MSNPKHLSGVAAAPRTVGLSAVVNDRHHLTRTRVEGPTGLDVLVYAGSHKAVHELPPERAWDRCRHARVRDIRRARETRRRSDDRGEAVRPLLRHDPVLEERAGGYPNRTTRKSALCSD